MTESDFQGEMEFSKSKEFELVMDEEVSGKIGGEVEGDIFIPMESELSDDCTLDEPVAVTLKRDFKAILNKFMHVLFPLRADKSLLHDWDLWGPLFLCITLAILLHGHSQKYSSNYTIHFIHVFLLVWGGAAVVTVNAQLLRGKVSFFQSVCTLGYCLLPLSISLVLSRLLLTVLFSLPRLTLTLRLAFVFSAMIWSTRASLAFLSEYLPKDRKILAIYPIALFYVAIGFLILAQNQPFI